MVVDHPFPTPDENLFPHGFTALPKENLREHWNHYKQSVQHYASLLAELQHLRRNKGGGGGLYRDRMNQLGFELGSATLHELFFSQMLPKPSPFPQEVCSLLEHWFGDIPSWEVDFLECTQTRGCGWVILFYAQDSGALFNQFVPQNGDHWPVGAKPLFVMDLWEHSWLGAYGFHGRQTYVKSMLEALDRGVLFSRMGNDGEFRHKTSDIQKI